MSTETQKPEKTEKNSYKQTLNLPQTAFPMEAKLVQNEPARLKDWDEMHLYERIQNDPGRLKKGKWILHDGPPFANGDIHLGHVINKTLKDVILRFRTMQGYQTPYVPGWDCHGLPIEHKIAEEIKKEKKNIREMSVLEVRKRCFEYAHKYVNVQCEQFKRLGILGEWHNPYLTMKPAYEAATLEVFAKFVEAGLVYRKLKPVPWSIANQTALADAELEYQDVDDRSVFVEFPLTAPVDGEPAFLLIWTTTPWTLPANLAVAVGRDIDYSLIEYKHGEKRFMRQVWIASDLVNAVVKVGGTAGHITLQTCKGSDLAGLEYRHPFVDRVGKVVLADYVTTTDGTGLVHTAPGHGEDDYETGLREKLEVYSPVLANGVFDETVPDWLRGKHVLKDGNALIIEHLKTNGHLFAEQTIRHSYPHDWRSKTPIIFRATEQWFVAMDKPFSFSGAPEGPLSLRDRALSAVNAQKLNEEFAEAQSIIEKVVDPMQTTADLDPLLKEAVEQAGINPSLKGLMQDAVGFFEQNLVGGSPEVDFVPAWGRNRIEGMLKTRPDWCVSRQRAWGLPIPVFYNDKGDALLTPESVRAVAKRVEEFGSDVWFTEEPAMLLGSDFQYPPGFTPTNLRKEKDIFDVWFESGSSWAAVLKARSYLHFPADLYLEGSDQHRGWFQLSLLPSLGATGQPPFKQVLTHGFVVKPDGTKVSKSDKEYVTATDEVKRHGADVLRLWCCSVDYQNDIPTSPHAIKEFGDKYRKIRNTLRYLLSNLYDYSTGLSTGLPTGLAASAASAPPDSLDGWILNQLETLIHDVTEGYDTYQLHRVFRLLHDFCSVQISSIYGNAMKDRLYCEAADAPLRRRCQAVMHKLVNALSKLLAPMIVFTADEAWCHIPSKPQNEADCGSVHMTLLPEESGAMVADQQKDDWTLLMQLRDSALGQLDELKKQVGLNKASESMVTYHLPAAVLARFKAWGVDLEDAVGAGHYELVETTGEPTVKMTDARNIHAACARCWKRRPGVDAETQLCQRCTDAMNQKP